MGDDVVGVVVVVAAVVVEVVVVVGEKMFGFVGLAVGNRVGRADAVDNGVGRVDVGNGVGRADVGNRVVGRADDIGTDTGGVDGVPPQPFPTFMATSAQFQNCSGTPRPSGGML